MDIKKTNMKNMKQDFITYLPLEIIVEILARLPARTILRWKCVCKSWQHLVETREFAKFHISKSVSGLALSLKMDKNIEHTNVLDIQHYNFDFGTFTKLYSTHTTLIQGSVDGLLLLLMCGRKSNKFELYVCNPITREYIDLHHSHPQQFDPSKLRVVMYGFGVSKISGQYKVVAILHDQTKPRVILPEPECSVYTIGTGSWRSIAPDALVRYNIYRTGAFVNGSLHWLAHDLSGALWISCFDLETELFTTFSPPPLRNDKTSTGVCLTAVEGTLCVCDYTSNYKSMVTIWLMKEHGAEKSWRKEFVIGKSLDIWRIISVYPIKISKDGIILMAPNHQKSLFYYSHENKTTRIICSYGEYVYLTSFPHIPTVLSLKCFRMENLISL